MIFARSPKTISPDAVIRYESFDIDRETYTSIRREIDTETEKAMYGSRAALEGAAIFFPGFALATLLAIFISRYGQNLPWPVSITAICIASLPSFLMAFLVRLRRRRCARWIVMSRHGLPICIRCGHNLTGIPDDVRKCPECGAERVSLNIETTTTSKK